MLAALAALVLHLLHIVEEGVLLAIALVLMALLLIRDFRREQQFEKITATVQHTEDDLHSVRNALKAPDAILIGPSELLSASIKFARRGRGDVVWFNVCLKMLCTKRTFDLLLKPFIENQAVSSIQFISDSEEKDLWFNKILPMIKECSNSNKVMEPLWKKLDETVSFILAETGEGNSEALVSFWGEPFMSKSVDREIPRYIFHVQEQSDLIARFKELERSHRLP